MSSVSKVPSFSLRAAAMSFVHAWIASTCLAGSTACEPTWNESPRTSIPSSAATRASASRASGSQPNLRDRSHIAPGERNDTRSNSSACSVRCANLRTSSGLSATKVRTPNLSALRMSCSRLIGCVWMQRSAATPSRSTSCTSPVVARSRNPPSSRTLCTTAACGMGFSA